MTITAHDISRLRVKRAQSFSGLTLGDLYREIQTDPNMAMFERIRLMTNLQSQVGGAPSSTPLSSLIGKGLGAILGTLIARYFGSGIMGQVAGGVLGYGVGGWAQNLFSDRSPFAGSGMMRLGS